LRLPPSLRLLLEAAASVASRSQAAKVAIARLDGIVDPAGLPPELRAPVADAIERALASTAEPLDITAVEKLLERAWEDRPSSVLDELDPEPLAVRPHAQAHRALLEGAEVVVKVARPGVAAATRSDLVLLDALAAPASAAFPRLDPGALTAEIRERVLDELDFEHEAQVHRRAARALRSLDGVSAPAIHTAWCTETVLVTDFVAGPSLADPGALDGADRGAIARALVRVYAGAPRAIGVVLANPRANDVVVRPDGEIALLGLGSQREVEPARVDAAVAAVRGLRDDDADGFASAAAQLGVLDDATALEAHRIALELAPELLCGPARLDAAALADLGERSLQRIEELMTVAVRATPDAADLWPARSFGQILPVLALLEAEEDWLTLALEAAREGW
jgi:predicted unusual protein kinase regulating ubiquinone biosynthesis (AarF/ABC1/UbiB family)